MPLRHNRIDVNPGENRHKNKMTANSFLVTINGHLFAIFFFHVRFCSHGVDLPAHRTLLLLLRRYTLLNYQPLHSRIRFLWFLVSPLSRRLRYVRRLGHLRSHRSILLTTNSIALFRAILPASGKHSAWLPSDCPSGMLPAHRTLLLDELPTHSIYFGRPWRVFGASFEAPSIVLSLL